MTNNTQTIEELKRTVEILEQSLSTTKDEETKQQSIKEIEFFKNLLLQKHRDITYSSAMNFNDFEKWIKNQGEQKKHQTGISFIDRIFGGDGIEEETFINLVGESGSGKSTLGLRILLNVAMRQKAYFISLEMGRFRTYNKISAMIDDYKQKENLYIDIWEDDLQKTLRNIELYAYNGCKFFLIDSKMKMIVKDNIPTHEKIAKMSNDLAKLTQKLGIIIILINQISEEDLRNKRVSLKGSGDQKFDTDILISIEMDKKDDNIRHFNVAKNRQNDEKPRIKYGLDFKELIDVDIGTMDNPIDMEVI